MLALVPWKQAWGVRASTTIVPVTVVARFCSLHAIEDDETEDELLTFKGCTTASIALFSPYTKGKTTRRTMN